MKAGVCLQEVVTLRGQKDWIGHGLCQVWPDCEVLVPCVLVPASPLGAAREMSSAGFIFRVWVTVHPTALVV